MTRVALSRASYIKREYARRLRKNQTAAEKEMWQRMRRKSLGVKVRRQVVIVGYIIDFYIPACSLAIEIDGSIHDHPAVSERDRHRSKHIENMGVRVIRFSNRDVFDAADMVEIAIRQAILERMPAKKPKTNTPKQPCSSPPR